MQSKKNDYLLLLVFSFGKKTSKMLSSILHTAADFPLALFWQRTHVHVYVHACTVPHSGTLTLV